VMEPGTVYLIHFDTPYKQAKHYLGWTSNLNWRMYHHRHNNGSRLLRALNGVGISYYVAKTWKGDRFLERKLKNWKNAPEICPVCIAERRNIKSYLCTRCGHKHYFRSMSGKRHYSNIYEGEVMNE
jgi:predicted GIY-YIG superfamily endonuclease